VGKQEEREFCLGCGKEVPQGVMTCFDCIAIVAPEFAANIMKGAKFFYDQMKKWHLEHSEECTRT